MKIGCQIRDRLKVLDVKVTPCTAASLSTGGSKIVISEDRTSVAETSEQIYQRTLVFFSEPPQ
jgi:hypothetical protein